MRRNTYLKVAFLVLFATIPLAQNCGPAEFSKGSDPGPGVTPNSCPGVVTDPTGCLQAACHGGVSNPRVEISWINHTSCFSGGAQNSNSLQKSDMYPSDPNQDWGWLWTGPIPPPGTMQYYTDTNVAAGTTYKYRAKYRAESPSNEHEVSIPLDSCFCRD